MQTQLRIVAGSLKGRRLACKVNEDMRPTPQMVREALFSILGNAVPDRPFYDLFAGTGVNGLEAISRGASMTHFVERDLLLSREIEKHIRDFQVGRKAKLFRTDAYRWVAAWNAPPEPVNVFISPPFPDLKERPDDMLHLLATLQEKVGDESVIVLQTERGSPLDDVEELKSWERRNYGRNSLLLWQRDDNPQPSTIDDDEATA
jgi:16S rRNA (guanine966-N2)-methyltransferase